MEINVSLSQIEVDVFVGSQSLKFMFGLFRSFGKIMFVCLFVCLEHDKAPTAPCGTICHIQRI